MKATISGWSCACILGLLIGSAPAQEQPAQSVDGGDADAAIERQSAGSDFFKASDLIGMEVRGSDNEELGEVQDLLIDKQTHEIQYLILDTGLFADLGGRQPVVPWMLADTQRGTEAETQHLIVPLTRERLESAPQIDISNVQLSRSAAWINQVDTFFESELKERRVSRPDLDRSERERAAPDQPSRQRSGTRQDRSNRPEQEDASPSPSPRRSPTDEPNANPPRTERRRSGAQGTPERQPNQGAENP